MRSASVCHYRLRPCDSSYPACVPERHCRSACPGFIVVSVPLARASGGPELDLDKLRSSLSTRVDGYTSLTPIDENCGGLHGYNAVKRDGGKVVFIRDVEFPPH